jgi:hypothetical protein
MISFSMTGVIDICFKDKKAIDEFSRTYLFLE